MPFDRRQFLKNAAGVGAAAVAGLGAVGAHHNGASAGQAAPIRPPGALPEPDFLTTCIRCMRCVDACPNRAIQSLPTSAGSQMAGTPHIEPRKQACMLCSRAAGDHLRCTEACPSGALQPIKKTLADIRGKVRMGVAQLDLNLCYSYNNYTCGTCFHACPLHGLALKVGMWERPEIFPDACVGCGLCERACIRYPQAVRVQPIDRPDLRRASEEVPA